MRSSSSSAHWRSTRLVATLSSDLATSLNFSYSITSIPTIGRDEEAAHISKTFRVTNQREREREIWLSDCSSARQTPVCTAKTQKHSHQGTNKKEVYFNFSATKINLVVGTTRVLKQLPRRSRTGPLRTTTPIRTLCRISATACAASDTASASSAISLTPIRSFAASSISGDAACRRAGTRWMDRRRTLVLPAAEEYGPP